MEATADNGSVLPRFLQVTADNGSCILFHGPTIKHKRRQKDKCFSSKLLRLCCGCCDRSVVVRRRGYNTSNMSSSVSACSLEQKTLGKMCDIRSCPDHHTFGGPFQSRPFSPLGAGLVTRQCSLSNVAPSIAPYESRFLFKQKQFQRKRLSVKCLDHMGSRRVGRSVGSLDSPSRSIAVRVNKFSSGAGRSRTVRLQPSL